MSIRSGEQNQHKPGHKRLNTRHSGNKDLDFHITALKGRGHLGMRVRPSACPKVGLPTVRMSQGRATLAPRNVALLPKTLLAILPSLDILDRSSTVKQVNNGERRKGNHR